jgi:hypothetical protein
MTKTAALSVRIEPELKAGLERLAEADRRSLASYVELVLQDHVKAATKRGRGRPIEGLATGG